LELSHESEGDPRVGLSRETFALMKKYGIGKSLAAYYSPASQNWRLSLVTSDLQLDEKGKVKRAFSNPRRYSFLLGKEAKIHTARAMLEQKGRVAGFPDLLSRFSLEVVNKEFYAQIARLYTRLVGGMRLEGAAETAYESELSLPGNPELPVREEFAVRLLGRAVFAWFLKKKGLIPEGLLSVSDFAEHGGYYHKRVEPLFFQALNTPHEERSRDFDSGDYGAVPFLNGGLFAPHRGDFYEYDGATATSVYLNTLKLPDPWIKDLLALLEAYNFTVDENTAVDVDLAIDPEMLGRIFENLLAEINPETGETARHKTGSFYTPRSVVEYMVTESLVSFLLGKVWPGAGAEAAAEARLRLEALFSWSEEAPEFQEEERLALITALHDMRCLDPACGSGAFPMSVLQKALHALERLDPNGEEWIDLQVAAIPDAATRAAARAALVGRGGGYARKLGLIQNCIYGVDIQPIAVEMARLRAFLALIVDEAVDDRKTNRGIEPLPNLEFKFVCADSLASLPGSRSKEVSLSEDASRIAELQKERAEYLISHGREKEKIKARYREIQAFMFNQVSWADGTDTKSWALSTWDPFCDGQAAWFDPFWMFGLKKTDGGYFDLVIANPPYVQLESMKEKAAEYKKENYSSFASRGDLYCLFYERGFELLKETGRLCYISSNKWMRTGYGEGLRRYFLGRTENEVLIDFGEAQLFESATTYTNILLGRPHRDEEKPVAPPRLLRDLSQDARSDSDFAGLVAEAPAKEADFSATSFLLLSEKEKELKKKIEERGTPLKDWNISINYGIKTGCNEAFVMDRATRDRLIAEDPASAELLKPLLRGRDIKRYEADFNGLWIITAGYGSYKYLKKEYPAIYRHLASFEESLKQRGQCRYSRSNKESKKEFPGQHHWLELDNNQSSDYFQLFEKEKLIYPNMTSQLPFYYDEEGYFTNDKSFIVTGAHLKYLTGILNTPIFKFIIKMELPALMGETYELRKIFMDPLPVCKPDRSSKGFVEEPSGKRREGTIASLIEYCVDKIQAGKKRGEDTAGWEKSVDRLVYELYDLDEAEIAIVEGRA
jgi:hypothetical protein